MLVKLKEKKLLIADGAWGTFLFNKGLKQGDCPELWNLTHPDEVRSIAADYIAAGAEIVKTNSFGGSAIKLKEYGLDNQTFEINKKAAQLSKEAAGDNALVMASVGPTGKFLFSGDVSYDEMYESFKLQCLGLEAGGADAILIETMMDTEEAICAIKAAKENTKATVICTMTFNKGVNGEYHTMFGISPKDMVTSLKEAGADIIGANCGNGIEGMIAITKEIRDADAEIPVLINANAGLPIFDGNKTVYPETPNEMAKQISHLVSAGANIIGGCCGTSPEHIKKIAQVIRALRVMQSGSGCSCCNKKYTSDYKI
jgi:5-methyltetrahydrofolate--homocysteine methyltransferase